MTIHPSGSHNPNQGNDPLGAYAGPTLGLSLVLEL